MTQAQLRGNTRKLFKPWLFKVIHEIWIASDLFNTCLSTVFSIIYVQSLTKAQMGEGMVIYSHEYACELPYSYE